MMTSLDYKEEERRISLPCHDPLCLAVSFSLSLTHCVSHIVNLPPLPQGQNGWKDIKGKKEKDSECQLRSWSVDVDSEWMEAGKKEWGEEVGRDKLNVVSVRNEMKRTLTHTDSCRDDNSRRLSTELQDNRGLARLQTYSSRRRWMNSIDSLFVLHQKIERKIYSPSAWVWVRMDSDAGPAPFELYDWMMTSYLVDRLRDLRRASKRWWWWCDPGPSSCPLLSWCGSTTASSKEIVL